MGHHNQNLCAGGNILELGISVPRYRDVTSRDDGRAASMLSHDYLGETSAKAAALHDETIGRVSLQSPMGARTAKLQ